MLTLVIGGKSQGKSEFIRTRFSLSDIWKNSSERAAARRSPLWKNGSRREIGSYAATKWGWASCPSIAPSGNTATRWAKRCARSPRVRNGYTASSRA